MNAADPGAGVGGAQVRVALDAMGGDHAPEAAVAGAREAVARWPDLEVRLVGASAVLERLLGGTPAGDRGRLPVLDAPDRVEMSESPVEAVRRKRANSVSLAVASVARGESQAVVSAGHTGAAVAAATLGLRLLPGVRRAGIAVVLPTRTGSCVMLDVGANIACKPEHLAQYASMGLALSRRVMGVPSPRAGILNIGEEQGKGTPLVQEADRLVREQGLPYAGYVEGRDIYEGKTDVVVCEGFVGNVVLKASEGLAETVQALLKENLLRTPLRRLGALLSKGAFREFRRRVDYAETGGALLMGVDGICVVAHGRSSPQAFASALGYARRCVLGAVNRAIVDGLASLAPASGTTAEGTSA